MVCARFYQPRQFDQTLLHQCVAEYWPQVRQACEAHGRPLSAFVKREFDAYLQCGDLGQGFLRIHCTGCGHDRLVPWATLLLRVFAIDVMVCPRCDSRMQRIAVIQQPKVIAAILDCLSRKENPP